MSEKGANRDVIYWFPLKPPPSAVSQMKTYDLGGEWLGAFVPLDWISREKSQCVLLPA